MSDKLLIIYEALYRKEIRGVSSILKDVSGMEEFEEAIFSEYSFLKDKKIEFEYKNTRYISFFDSEYPEELKRISSPPLILFYRGNIEYLRYKMVEIVGSRNAS